MRWPRATSSSWTSASGCGRGRHAAPAALRRRHDVGRDGAPRGRWRWRPRGPRPASPPPRTWRKRSAISAPLAFDMGGTTTDVCLIADGVAETSSQRRSGLSGAAAMAAVESIGAGGAPSPTSTPPAPAVSDRAGRRRAGPRATGPAAPSHGHRRQPRARLSRSGAPCTAAPSVSIASARASRWTRSRGGRLSLSRPTAGVIEVANAAMLAPLRLVLRAAGYDLRDFTLIAYGGAGPVTRGRWRLRPASRACWVPAHSGAFRPSAAWSRRCLDAVRTYRGGLRGVGRQAGGRPAEPSCRSSAWRR